MTEPADQPVRAPASRENERTPNASEPTDTTETDRNDDHLAGVEVGAGCTEIWEHLAERREE